MHGKGEGNSEYNPANTDSNGLGSKGSGRTREVVSHGVMLGVVLELLGRHGGAEEVLEVLEDVLLGRSKGARLRVVMETGHACVDTGEEGDLLLVRGRRVCFLAVHNRFLLSLGIFSSYDF